MNFTWLTDIHINFLDEEERFIFYQQVKKHPGKSVFITGDIAEATCIEAILQEIAEHVNKPIYFVLGNHDYYHGRVDEVQELMRKLNQNHQRLFWLNDCDPIEVEPNTFLVGIDGWADGRLGDYENSNVVLSDRRAIADLYHSYIHGKAALLKKRNELADRDANILAVNLQRAVDNNAEKIIILTHIPPFRECCYYQGHITTDDFLPFFSSKATGDVLTRFAKSNPEIYFLTLCGHTHSSAHYQPLNNLEGITGKAEYHLPEIQEIDG